jgi:uncharacterized membrane protein
MSKDRPNRVIAALGSITAALAIAATAVPVSMKFLSDGFYQTTRTVFGIDAANESQKYLFIGLFASILFSSVTIVWYWISRNAVRLSSPELSQESYLLNPAE